MFCCIFVTYIIYKFRHVHFFDAERKDCNPSNQHLPACERGEKTLKKKLRKIQKNAKKSVKRKKRTGYFRRMNCDLTPQFIYSHNEANYHNSGLIVLYTLYVTRVTVCSSLDCNFNYVINFVFVDIRYDIWK